MFYARLHPRTAIAAIALSAATIALASPGDVAGGAGRTSDASPAASATPAIARTTHGTTIRLRHRVIVRTTRAHLNSYSHATNADRARINAARLAHQIGLVATLTHVGAQRHLYEQSHRANLAARTATYRIHTGRTSLHLSQ